MRTYPVTKQLTLWGRLSNIIWVSLAAFFVSLPLVRSVDNEDLSLIIPMLALAWFVYGLIRLSALGKWEERRTNDLLILANSYGAQFTPSPKGFAKDFSLMSLEDLGNQRDKHCYNVITAKEWTYCDYSYAVYRKTKNSEYKAATIYYGIMSMRLPRLLPNVFFDSLKSRRRQFRFHFTRKQRHSLEGDFDRYFATYFPENYAIDSLSFISPDVMEALKAAADYDIEIIGDRIFMYGPQDDPDSQLPDMIAKIGRIRQQLLDNILTYRDERLPFAEGRQRVSVQGANLKRSLLLKRLTLTGAIFYILARIILEVWANME